MKRFVNQDILSGNLSNSQSPNRYSYVQGNPVSYTAPFGQSPLNGLFSGSSVRHAFLGLASYIPVIGFVASAADAWFYYREGNTAMAATCTVDAVIGLFGVTESLLRMASKTRRVGKAIQIAAKIGNGGYRPVPERGDLWKVRGGLLHEARGNLLYQGFPVSTMQPRSTGSGRRRTRLK